MEAVPSRTSFTRRRMLTVMGVGAAAAAAPVVAHFDGSSAQAATAAANCSTDTDEQEVGPFYVAEGIVRSDITSGEDGVPLTFSITVTDSDTCEPLVGAAVDVWHASALGIYSDESSENTVGETFLRGIQLTDSNGAVTFTSIYPGWYSGRTNHIHARIYTGGTVSGTSYDYSEATLVWTGQMFFDPDANAAVAAVAPYTSNHVTRTTNAEDRVYTTQHGSETLTTLSGNVTDGYTSSVAYTVAGSGSSTGGSDTTSLSITASAASATYGEPVTLSGTLLDVTTSGGLSGETIVIKVKLSSGKTSKVTTTTGSGGAWSLTFRPTRSAAYTAHFVATSDLDAATSSTLHVKVHYKVSVTDVTRPHGSSTHAELSGAISPATAHHHVTLRELHGNSADTLVRVRTDHKGEWSARWHVSHGKHHVEAVAAATDKLAKGTSRTIAVKR